jgi:hypothetical protein
MTQPADKKQNKKKTSTSKKKQMQEPTKDQVARSNNTVEARFTLTSVHAACARHPAENVNADAADADGRSGQAHGQKRRQECGTACAELASSPRLCAPRLRRPLAQMRPPIRRRASATAPAPSPAAAVPVESDAAPATTSANGKGRAAGKPLLLRRLQPPRPVPVAGGRRLQSQRTRWISSI